jgi:TatD DNase family protein
VSAHAFCRDIKLVSLYPSAGGRDQNFSVFINIHTHARIHDAKVEVVSLQPGTHEKPEHYSYGLHPWLIVPENVEAALDELRMISHEPRCLALGECGLDKLSKVNFDLQLEVFEAQVKIANDINKPLIIHCVKAFNELINCLNMCDNQVPVIIHGFNNNENIARLLESEGYYLSFGKALLGYESNAAKAIKNTGRRKFFLETDDADISIKYIYMKAATLLGIDEEILKAQLHANFTNVFKIKT